MAIEPQIGYSGHDRRVAHLSVDIGRQLRLAPDALDVLRRAGLLHDIGKRQIPIDIVEKASELNESEWRVMRTHPELGFAMLGESGHFSRESPAVLYHHERMDGTGYPHGLSGAEIPIEARVIAVADTYDVLTSDRPYRRALNCVDAMTRVREAAGVHLDAVVVEALVRALALRPRYLSVA